jgi:tRNA U34 5-carboxymethylaminomethyl modifying enzyme MnmG/GidA
LAQDLLFTYTEFEINCKKQEAYMRLNDIKKNYNLINSVDWEMTPEEAIALHLEWGPLRSQSYYNSRDNNNETVYFVINTWKKNPILTLVRRKGFDSEELGTFDLPKDVASEFMQGIGKYKGVYAVEGKVREWLRKELDA